MRLAAALLFLTGCASMLQRPAPVVAHASDEDVESGMRVVARILADACTAEETDEVLIEHTMLLLKGCRIPPSACLRRTCLRLDKSSKDDEGFHRVTAEQRQTLLEMQRLADRSAR